MSDLQELYSRSEMLKGDLADAKTALGVCEDQIAALMAKEFEASRADKAYGIIGLSFNGLTVKQDVKKKVKWDQDALVKCEEDIISHNDDPSNYIETKRSIKESLYNKMPDNIKSFFDTARIVEDGTVTYKITEE